MADSLTQDPASVRVCNHISSIFFSLFSMERHEEDLKTTLGTRGTTESLHTRLKEHLKEKEKELKETTKNLQKLKEQLSSKQTRKRMIV